ncbi:DUF72 domain-containing protein [soil metagenome]
MGELLVGTASWTDRSLIGSGWYPKGASSAKERLEFYSSQFPLVEVDSSYYFLPSDKNAALWADRTPDDFTFNIKAFSLLTRHPTKPGALKEFGVAEDVKKNVYIDDLPPAVVDAVWDSFLGALEPLRASDKLGLILFQFPQWFTIGKGAKRYVLDCARRAAPDPVAVEFRNKTWMSEGNRRETLDFLAGHGLPYVAVDMPQGFVSSLPPVAEATADVSVVRFHGRNVEDWESGSVQRRFKYLYSESELREWAPRLARLTRESDTTHVLMNNCYRDYAQRNARELAALMRSGAG